MKTLPLDSSVEAEYSDGYIHSETDLNDQSPYEKTANVFNDILEKRPEAEHGRMVRFSVFYKNARYDVDWTTLPDNARPIRFRHMERASVGGVWVSDPVAVRIEFGYQYNDESGANQQEIMEL